MTSTDYLPGNGTHGAFIAAYVHSLPAGIKVGSATIAEACDVGITALINATGASVAAGLITCEKFGNRCAWSAGPRSVPQEFIDAHPPKRHVEIRPFVPPVSATPPAALGRSDAPEVFRRTMTERFVDTGPEDKGRTLTPAEVAALGLKAFGAEPVDDEPVPASTLPPAQPEHQPRRRIQPLEPARAMRVGIFSDGAICIERAGRVETYTPAEAEELMRFFTRFLLRGMEQA